MKTVSTNLLNAISNDDLRALTTETMETLAVDFNEKNAKVFSAVDVWNIQRRKRARVQRRFLLL